MRACIRYLSVLAFFTIFFFPAASPGGPADWQWYYSTVTAKNKSGNSMSIKEYYDPGTVKHTQKDSVAMWIKASLEGNENSKIDTVMRSIEINCIENRYRTLKLIRSFRNKPVDELPVDTGKWETFTVGSSWSSLCETIGKQK